MQNTNSLYDDDFVQRYRHRSEPRHAKTMDTLGIAEFGHCMDTLCDLLHLTLLTETHPILPAGDPTEITPQHFPPPYVLHSFGDYREGQSFYRHDKHTDHPNHYPLKPGKCKGVSAFAESLHSFSRGGSKRLAGNVVWPDTIIGLRKSLKQSFRQYREMVQESGDYSHMVQDARGIHILEKIHATVDALTTELADMQTITIAFPFSPQPLEIDNNGAHLLNAKLPKSFLANVLFHLEDAANSVADATKAPPYYSEAGLQAIGAESLITDTIEGLMRCFGKQPGLQPFVCQYETSLREKIKTDVTHYAYDLALFAQYHRMLSGAYTQAYDDIDHLLALSECPRSVALLREPEHAACLLYAASTRIANRLPEINALAIRNLADNVASCHYWPHVAQCLQQNASALLALKEAQLQLHDPDFTSGCALITQIPRYSAQAPRSESVNQR